MLEQGICTFCPAFKITEGQVFVVVHDVYRVNTCTPSDLNFQTMHAISDRGLPSFVSLFFFQVFVNFYCSPPNHVSHFT